MNEDEVECSPCSAEGKNTVDAIRENLGKLLSQQVAFTLPRPFSPPNNWPNCQRGEQEALSRSQRLPRQVPAVSLARFFIAPFLELGDRLAQGH